MKKEFRLTKVWGSILSKNENTHEQVPISYGVLGAKQNIETKQKHHEDVFQTPFPAVGIGYMLY